MNKAAIALVIVILVGGYEAWKDRVQTHPPGVTVRPTPVQQNFETPQASIKYKDVTLDPLAEFSLEGRVLSTKSYTLDRLAKIVPTDVAIGWGFMSDTATLEKLRIRQADRFYFYSWKNAADFDPKELAVSSANMHLIPANKFLEAEIEKLRKGQLIRLRGKLVRVIFKDGSDAKSSLVREDTGAGACEIVWVEDLVNL